MRWALTAASALAIIVTASSTPNAEVAGTAYVDDIANYTSEGDDELRGHIGDALRQAGFDPALAAPTDEPCAAENAGCLAERARARGAVMAVRATWMEIAGETSVAVDVVTADGRTARHVVRHVELSEASPALAAAFAAIELAPPARARSKAPAWTLAGVSGALALGGGASSLWAWQTQRAFFNNHVNEEGDVVGISPSGAKSIERRARAWSLAGAILLTGAVASGITAGLVFAADSSEPGVGVSGRF